MAKKKTDQKILDLIAVAKKKKESIAKAEKPNWKTNCSFAFSFEGNVQRYNLQVLMDVNTLVLMLAFLQTMCENFDKANNVLGLTESFKWHGFTYEDWKSDIETRITKLQLKKEKDALELIESRLSKLISPELR